MIYGSDELRGNVTVGMYVGGQEHTPARTMSYVEMLLSV